MNFRIACSMLVVWGIFIVTSTGNVFAADSVKLTRSGDTVGVTINGEEFATYQFAKSLPKPFFSPVKVAGTQISRPIVGEDYKGDHPQLKVTISTVGFEGKKIEVELVREDQPDANPIRRVVTCVGTSSVVEFDLDASDTGRKSFVVRTPVQEGETRDDNNSRTFSLSVVDDRAKVLLVEGESRGVPRCP